MHNGVTFGDLERLLTQSGFVRSPSTGSQKLFRHQSFDAIIVLPGAPATDAATHAHLAAVRRTLSESGVIDAESFDKLLEQIYDPQRPR